MVICLGVALSLTNSCAVKAPARIDPENTTGFGSVSVGFDSDAVMGDRGLKSSAGCDGLYISNAKADSGACFCSLDRSARVGD